MNQSQFVRLAALAAFAGMQVICAQSGDPRSKLAGAYVFSESGSASGQRVSGVGLLQLDASGSVSGWQTIRGYNLTLATSIAGTYTADTEGSGTLNLTHTLPASPGQDEGATVSAQYKFLSLTDHSGAMELRAIRSENGLAVSATLTRASTGVSLSGLKGAYVLTEHGVLGTSETAMSAIGRMIFDGKGNVSGWEVTRARGLAADVSIDGSYSVGTDGKGILTLTHKLPEPLTLNGSDSYVEQYSFVVAGSSEQKSLIALRVDSGVVCIANLTPQ